MVKAGVAASNMLTSSVLIFIFGTSCGDQNFTVTVRLHSRYQTGLFHLFQQSGCPVVTDTQMTLHRRNRSATILDNDLNSLVVQRVRFSIDHASSGVDPLTRFAF